jgi:hypothetical protein
MSECLSAMSWHWIASIQIWTQLPTGVLAGPVPCFLPHSHSLSALDLVALLAASACSQKDLIFYHTAGLFQPSLACAVPF